MARGKIPLKHFILENNHELPIRAAILKERNLNIETAREPELEAALIEAFQRDLPLGFKRVEALVQKQQQNGSRAMMDADSSTDEAKQFIRLFASDVAKKALENHFGVKLAFYNCHKGFAAPSTEDLKISAREQILSQDPSFIDC